jgi:hypothetical protein
MNDEYLWQKTGADPDIEKLEQKLAVFRYREAPLNAPLIEKAAGTAEVPRWRISLAFAFAGSVMAALLVAVVFISIAKNSDDETVFVAGPELEVASPPPAAVEEEKIAPAPKVVPQFAHSTPRSVTRPKPDKERRPKTKDLRPHSSVAALTQEERYAYRQLMLALSISSSKLKIVQDTINGNENGENSSNDKR